MKLVPAFIQTLHKLPWRGDISVETFQRLTVHLYLGMVLSILGFVIAGGALALVKYGAGDTPNPYLNFLMVALVFVVIAAFIASFCWYLVQSVKLEILRLRNLGLTTYEAIAVQAILAWIISVPSMVYVFYHTNWQTKGMDASFNPTTFHYLLLSLIPATLYQYWVYFETTPLCRNVNPALTLQPLSGVASKGEKVGLFLLQTYTWYSILKTPLDILFPSL